MTHRPESPVPMPAPERERRRKKESPLQQKLRRIRRNRFWLLLFLWLAAAIPELVLHTVTSGSIGAFWNSGLVLGPLFALTPALILFLLCTWLPSPGVNFGICLIHSGVMFLLHGSQLVYYRIFRTFFSFRFLISGSDISRFTDAILSTLRGSAIPILAMGFPFFVLLFWGRKLFSFRPLKGLKGHIPLVVACVLVHLLTILILPLFGGRADTTPYELYHRTSDTYLTANRLGLFTAFRLDVQRTLTGRESTGSIVLESTPAETTLSSEATGLFSAEPSETVHADTPQEANLLDIDFTVLARNEDNAAVAELHEYFAGRTSSLKNGKTGLFRGSNLILITAESFNHLAVSQELTPTLYAMTQEGYLFTDYYIPDWGISTDGVYATLTGTIPQSGEWSADVSVGNYMPLTMVQQLIRQGYTAFGYSGEALRPFLENLGYEWNSASAESASALFDRTIAHYAGSGLFTAFYALDGQGGMQELEQSITLLLTRLRAAQALDETVILLLSESPGTEASEGSCVIWKSGTEPETINTPASNPDLLPTLSNLFGLEFDSRLYMGRDVFSSAQPLVIFPDRSWITDLAIYNTGTGEVTTLSDDPVDQSYMDAINREVSNRLAVSARILEHDYWRILFG